MSIHKSRIYHNTPNRSMNTGEEILRLWLEYNNMRLAIQEFNRRHEGEDSIQFSGSAFRRMRFWIVREPEKAMQIIADWGDWEEVEIQEKVVFYAVREFRDYRTFLNWVEKHPWAKKFEKDYNAWYALGKK